MTELVHYEVRDRIAHVTIDNGKANALSPDVIAGLDDALTPRRGRGRGRGRRAAASPARPGMLSGGFDLKVMRGGPEAAGKLVTDGGELFARMFGRRSRWSSRAPVTRSRRARCCCSAPTTASAPRASSASA